MLTPLVDLADVNLGLLLESTDSNLATAVRRIGDEADGEDDAVSAFNSSW